MSLLEGEARRVEKDTMFPWLNEWRLNLSKKESRNFIVLKKKLKGSLCTQTYCTMDWNRVINDIFPFLKQIIGLAEKYLIEQLLKVDAHCVSCNNREDEDGFFFCLLCLYGWQLWRELPCLGFEK
jgi:hypothetical protein